MVGWIKGRLGERTSLDGVTLVVICGSIILFGGIAKFVAWAGLAWAGVGWTGMGRAGMG